MSQKKHQEYESQSVGEYLRALQAQRSLFERNSSSDIEESRELFEEKKSSLKKMTPKDFEALTKKLKMVKSTTTEPVLESLRTCSCFRFQEEFSVILLGHSQIRTLKDEDLEALAAVATEINTRYEDFVPRFTEALKQLYENSADQEEKVYFFRMIAFFTVCGLFSAEAMDEMTQPLMTSLRITEEPLKLNTFLYFLKDFGYQFLGVVPHTIKTHLPPESPLPEPVNPFSRYWKSDCLELLKSLLERLLDRNDENEKLLQDKVLQKRRLEMNSKEVHGDLNGQIRNLITHQQTLGVWIEDLRFILGKEHVERGKVRKEEVYRPKLDPIRYAIAFDDNYKRFFSVTVDVTDRKFLEIIAPHCTVPVDFQPFSEVFVLHHKKGYPDNMQAMRVNRTESYLISSLQHTLESVDAIDYWCGHFQRITSKKFRKIIFFALAFQMVPTSANRQQANLRTSAHADSGVRSSMGYQGSVPNVTCLSATPNLGLLGRRAKVYSKVVATLDIGYAGLGKKISMEIYRKALSMISLNKESLQTELLLYLEYLAYLTVTQCCPPGVSLRIGNILLDKMNFHRLVCLEKFMSICGRYLRCVEDISDQVSRYVRKLTNNARYRTDDESKKELVQRTLGYFQISVSKKSEVDAFVKFFGTLSTPGDTSSIDFKVQKNIQILIESIKHLNSINRLDALIAAFHEIHESMFFDDLLTEIHTSYFNYLRDANTGTSVISQIYSQSLIQFLDDGFISFGEMLQVALYTLMDGHTLPAARAGWPYRYHPEAPSATDPPEHPMRLLLVLNAVYALQRKLSSASSGKGVDVNVDPRMELLVLLVKQYSLTKKLRWDVAPKVRKLDEDFPLVASLDSIAAADAAIAARDLSVLIPSLVEAITNGAPKDIPIDYDDQDDDADASESCSEIDDESESSDDADGALGAW